MKKEFSIMNSHYDQVLTELTLRTEKLARKYIPLLYKILSEEERLSPEDCRAKLQHDCDKIWAKDTIRKHLPAEAKDAVKRKAGKISASVKKERREKEYLASNVSNLGQSSIILGVENDSDNSVGFGPTENGSIWHKDQESQTIHGSDINLTFRLSLLDDDVWHHMIHHHFDSEKGSLLWISGVINTETRKIVSASIDCHSTDLH
jgi:hypothetical protein